MSTAYFRRRNQIQFICYYCCFA